MIDEKRLITDIEINLVCVGDEQVKRHVNEAKNVIIKIIKHQPKVNEWIPVDERLPKDGDERALCYGKEIDKVNREMCFKCKEKWLDSEIDM